MKCPIVCSRIPGNIDIVEDNETGLIFTVRDEEDLYRQLKTAITDLERMKKMAEALREKIEKNFDTRQVRRFLEEKYRSLLGKRKEERKY